MRDSFINHHKGDEVFFIPNKDEIDKNKINQEKIPGIIISEKFEKLRYFYNVLSEEDNKIYHDIPSNNIFKKTIIKL